FGELFGMPREVAPPSYREFRVWWERKLASEEMYLTPEAREIGYSTAFEIPLPSLRAPAKALHDLIMLGSVPPRVRELYGIGYSVHQERAFRATVRALRGLRPITPRVIREGYNTSSFRLVARTERRRLERGERTPQVA
ncbi:MAG: oxygenase MpaB family protein, partial [Solirubrobacterales bacterium]